MQTAILIPKTKDYFMAVCAAAGWQDGDGPLPGVWLSRQPGEQCLWSCRWMTDKGILLPDLLIPLDMSPVGDLTWTTPYLQAEIVDLANRGDPVAARLTGQDYGYNIHLTAARRKYREYTAYWTDRPKTLAVFTPRRGYPYPKWFRR